MKSRRPANLLLKTGQALFLAVAVCAALGASDAGSRFTDLGHRLMCTCGCAQLLGECNHVGCQSSDKMRGELRDEIASSMGDQQILDAFSAKYGVTVLAAPAKHGFDLVAWIAPFAVFGAALLGTILLVRHWSIGTTQLATAGSENASPEMAEIHAKIRRETGADGGY